MKRWLVRIALALAVVAVFPVAFWQMHSSTRPPLTTDPATLAGDGSTTRMDRICALPKDQKVPKARGRRLAIL